ncbi:hypothetical protein QW131_03480 [Roseibium salinum]|nr:hypothetical protein [Roseibium salinum]
MVLTRTNAAVTTRAMRAVQDFLCAQDIDVLMTPIVERAAFRDLFEFGGGLSNLDPSQVSGVAKAREKRFALCGRAPRTRDYRAEEALVQRLQTRQLTMRFLAPEPERKEVPLSTPTPTPGTRPAFFPFDRLYSPAQAI